ncbi:MAG: histidine kinase [Myxococcota bacterium]
MSPSRPRTAALLSEPRPAPRSTPRRRDVALGLLVFALAVAELVFRTELTALAFSVLLVAAPAIALRRVHPFAALAAAFLASAGVDLVQLATGARVVDLASSMFMLTLPYALLRWGSGAEIRAGVLLSALTFALGVVADGLSLGDTLGGIAVLGGAFALGLAMRFRARSRAQELEAAKLRERERIARDLHDTVAHHVSGIAVRAQAGLALAGQEPAAATDALRVIAEEASRTLEEMRAMVGILRAERAPALSSLESLADESARPPVRVTLSGDVEGVGEATRGALQRIAREAITNARKHARGASRIDVRVSVDERGARLEIADDGGAPSRRPSPAGYGLVGMRERAELLGGTLEAGPIEGGGWRVVGFLPRRGSAR